MNSMDDRENSLELDELNAPPPSHKEVQLDNEGNPVLDQSEESPSEPQQPQLQKVGRFATIMNLINALIGAGIISVPGTFAYTGVGPTTLLLMVCAALCQASSVIILRNQSELGFTGLDEMALMVFGKWAEVTTSILIILFSASCTVAYLIIGATQIRSWIGLTGIDVSSNGAWYLCVICYWALIDMPLTLFKSVKFLSKFAMFGVIAVVYFAAVVSIKAFIAFSNGSAPHDTAIGLQMDFGIFTAFGIHALTFSLPVIFMPIIAPYNPSIKKRSIVLGITYLVSWVLITLPGVLGYLEFGSTVKGDILQNFDPKDIAVNIAKAAIFLSVSLSFPAIVLSIVGAIGQLTVGQNVPELMPNGRRLLYALIVDVVNLVLAMFLQDIRPVLGVGGSLGGCMVSFVLPSACHLKITKEKWTTPGNILHIIFVIFGLASTVLCTVSSVDTAIDAFTS